MKSCLVFCLVALLCCALLAEGGRPRMLPQEPDGYASQARIDYFAKCVPSKATAAECEDLLKKLCSNPKARCRSDGAVEILSQGDYVMEVYDKNGVQVWNMFNIAPGH